MVCSHCGRLNPNESETCARCGRPLAATAADMCAVHPDRRAIARCCQCDRALCDECNVLVGGSPYCEEHADGLTVSGSAGGLLDAPVVNIAAKSPANFGQRLQAGLIDLVLYGVFLLILYILLWSFVGSPPTHEDAGGWRVLFWLLAILAPLAYLIAENASGGRTIGKSASDLIALREDGRIMDLETAALRAVLSLLGFLLGGIGFWAILWDPKCRALHDRWTHTIVIRD